MKDYVNRADRDRIVAVVSIGDWLGRQAEITTKNKELRKYLKTAATFTMKALDCLANSVPTGAWDRVLKHADNYHLSLIPKEKAKVKVASLSVDDIYILADFALAGYCWQCGEDPQSCELREVLKRLDIPKAREEICEYKQKR